MSIGRWIGVYVYDFFLVKAEETDLSIFYAPAILTIGTYEYIYGRTGEAIRLLLDLVNLPDDTEDLVIIIGKAATFLLERHDIGMAMKLYSAALENFSDEQTFQDGVVSCTEREK